MKIIINRDSGYADSARAYHVILDGKDINKIRQGQTLEFELEKGFHQLYLKIDWTGSNKVDFEIKDTDIKFNCKSNLSGYKVIFGLFYLIQSFFDPTNWISLEKVN